jgi:translation initiation factor 1
MPPNRVVYDTALGRTDRCSYCRRQLESCVCPNGQRVASATVTPKNGVRVHRDRKGRRGKTVTVITGLPNQEAMLRELATELKRLCGSGGTIADGNVEIQGDHREKVAARLAELGFSVKLAGG